jgi:hypothetical protein
MNLHLSRSRADLMPRVCEAESCRPSVDIGFVELVCATDRVAISRIVAALE